jgi:class 3 adenylate cyclase/pSer/pThr/pTyr-binding forkhead associated (FHA) protein
MRLRFPFKRNRPPVVEAGSNAPGQESPSIGPWGRLTVLRGLPGAENTSFLLALDKISIGRSPDCDVVIPESGVSRAHAELRRAAGQVVLVHGSSINRTYVDGQAVDGRRALGGGEEIQLADRVVLRFELETSIDSTQMRQISISSPGLITAIRQQVELQDRIERKFRFRGSFVDVDVVDSYGLKARATRPDAIIYSFDRFRDFACRVIEEFEGHFLNSNGDEIMSFFESANNAVRYGSALLERLPEFNQTQNRLDAPFRVRIGVHTGEALVDRRRGVAFSTALDIAGHLQKHAPIGGLLVSEQTLEALGHSVGFEEAGSLEREGIRTYRFTIE